VDSRSTARSRTGWGRPVTHTHTQSDSYSNTHPAHVCACGAATRPLHERDGQTSPILPLPRKPPPGLQLMGESVGLEGRLHRD